jgi:hypothetical protein
MIRQASYVSASPIAELSPELARDWGLLAGPNERSMRRRVGWVWGLLFFNVMTYAVATTNLIPLPSQVGKLLPESAVGVALLLILTANKRLLVRPNIYLILVTAMCLCAAMMSFRGYFGLGSMIRWSRYALFVGALWLTTPWWGRRDLMILQFQRRALMVVMVTVIVGVAFSPTKAFGAAGGGRLGGIIWPIQPTQVAHYAAMLVGMTVVLWLAGVSRSRWTGFRRSDPHTFPSCTHRHVGGNPCWWIEPLPQSEASAAGRCGHDPRGGNRRAQLFPAHYQVVRQG